MLSPQHRSYALKFQPGSEQCMHDSNHSHMSPVPTLSTLAGDSGALLWRGILGSTARLDSSDFPCNPNLIFSGASFRRGDFALREPEFGVEFWDANF